MKRIRFKLMDIALMFFFSFSFPLPNERTLKNINKVKEENTALSDVTSWRSGS